MEAEGVLLSDAPLADAVPGLAFELAALDELFELEAFDEPALELAPTVPAEDAFLDTAGALDSPPNAALREEERELALADSAAPAEDWASLLIFTLSLGFVLETDFLEPALAEPDVDLLLLVFLADEALLLGADVFFGVGRVDDLRGVTLLAIANEFSLVLFVRSCLFVCESIVVLRCSNLRSGM